MAPRVLHMLPFLPAGLAQWNTCNGHTAGTCAAPTCSYTNGRCEYDCNRAGYSYTPNMDGGGATNVVSWEACQTRCQNTVNCAYYSFNTATGTCTLQATGAQQTQTANTVSGARNCVPWTTNPNTQCNGETFGNCAANTCRWVNNRCENNCDRAGWGCTPNMANGGAIQTNTWQDCQTRCRNTNGCAHYSYNTATRTCSLQDAGAACAATANTVSGSGSCVPWNLQTTTTTTTRQPFVIQHVVQPVQPPVVRPMVIATSGSMPGDVPGTMQAGRNNAGFGFNGLSDAVMGAMPHESMKPDFWKFAVASAAALFVGVTGLAVRNRNIVAVDEE